MKKCRMIEVGMIAALLCLWMGFGAQAEQYDGYSYNAHFVTYDSEVVDDWSVMDYAETGGVLLSMYKETAEVSVSLAEVSEAPTLDELVEQQIAGVGSYATILSDVVRDEWYAPWLESDPGCRIAYSYAFEGSAGDSIYHVVSYMAQLDDDYYVVVKLTDWSDDVEAEASALEAGLLESFGIDEFTVTGSVSAYLTRADESDGRVYLTLQPFTVTLSADQLDYSIEVSGDTQVVPLSADARVMVPADDDSGMLENVALTADAIGSFIDGYQAKNGKDCVFNVLLSGDEARWVAYSYLY